MPQIEWELEEVLIPGKGEKWKKEKKKIGMQGSEREPAQGKKILQCPLNALSKLGKVS